MIFDNDFSIDIKAILALFLGGSLVACTGGDGGSSTVTVPTPPAAPVAVQPKVYFNKIVSSSVRSGGSNVSSKDLKLYYEAIAVQDVNGDGYKDLIITNQGDPAAEIQNQDPPIAIFLNDTTNKFFVADTKNLAPTGWVNDYVFLDSDNDGIKEIIAVDQGREVTGKPLGTAQLRAYEWDGSKFVELTSKTADNTPAFNHNSSSVGDINGDGLLDFTVATISGNSKLYYGDRNTVFKLGAEYRFSDFGSTGATAILPTERLAVFLPYNTWQGDADFNNAEFVKDGQTFKQDARTGVLPNNYGYSFINISDINGDGRTDFVALAENPNSIADGKRVFVTFMQKADGTFDIFNSFPYEQQITDSKLPTGWLGTIWSDHKFSLIDIDGDKKLDLFWGSEIGATSSDLRYNVFYGDGSGHFARNETKSTELFKDVTWDGTARTLMTDVNGDGLGDLIVLQEYNNLITPIVYINNGVVL